MNTGLHGHDPGRRRFNRLVLSPALLITLVILLGGGRVLPAAGSDDTGTAASKVRSEKLVEKRVNGEKIRYLYGNVFIDRDTLTAAADTAEDHVDAGYYVLLGRVVLTSRNTVLHCTRAVYRRGSGASDFSGDIKLIDGDLVGTSLRGEVRGEGRYIRLIDQARMVGPDYIVSGDTIFQDRQTDLSMAMGRVRIEKPVKSKPIPAAADSDSTAAADSSGVLGVVEAPEDSIWTLDCNRAVFQGNREDSDFYGDVRLIDGDMIGTGEHAVARQGGDIFSLIGNALLVTTDYTIRADEITRNTETGQGEASGKVSIVEPGSRNVVTGEHALFDSEGGTALVDSLPALTSREESGGPLSSLAGRMRFFKDEDKVVMVDSVRIHQEDTRASADSAVVYGRRRMILVGEPSVRLGHKNLLTGDRIEFQYEQGNLRRMSLLGGARLEDSTPDSLAAIYRGLPPLDVLSGDSITIDFEDGKIRQTIVTGGAKSHYTPEDITDEIATNDVAGDTIIIDFRGDRVRKVDVYGGVTGTYRFAKIAEMRTRRKRETVPGPLTAATDSQMTTAVDSIAGAAVDSLAAMVAPDTLASVVSDTLAAMAAPDTLGMGQFDFTGATEEVKYKGKQVTFELDHQSMEIRRDGELNYGTMTHTADHILLNTTTRELYSEGHPYLKDHDAVVGDLMGYNFKYKTGAVKNGVTSMDGYYYVGDSIRRYPDGTMKIKGGKMSSCDLERPHYLFWSNNMKIRQGDKVVAAPIVLKIGHVPVFALPFYFKSLKSGRQSGILFPSFDFGWSSREGRYIRDFGYYWATNDYMDFILEGDYNEHRDLSYRVSNRYVKRYSFNGTVDYSRQISLGSGEKSRQWQLIWNHNQPALFDDYKFRANVRMSSSSLSSNDLTSSVNRDIVSGQMKSTVYLSRNWSFLSASLNANRDGRVNAKDSDPNTDNLVYTMTLPSLTLNFRQFTLKGPLHAGKRGSLFGDLLRNTYVQHSYLLDSSRTSYELKDAVKYHANGKGSISLRPPRVGIFNVSFAANAAQDWSRTTTQGQTWKVDSDTTGHFDPLYQRTEDTKPSLRVSSSVGTTLYGLFPLKVGRLRALRHTTKLNASWNLTPTIRGHQKHSTRVALSWSNRLDLKYAASTDSNAVEKKLDGLIDWNLTTNYNPDQAPGARWGDINSSLSIKPGQSRYLEVKVGNVIDPRTLSLKSTRFNYNLSFSGKLDLGAAQVKDTEQKNDAIDRLGPTEDQKPSQPQQTANDPFAGQTDSPFANYAQMERRKEGGPKTDVTDGGRYIPFNLNTSISYSYTNASATKRANANFSVSANLTRNWEFRYNTSFDLDVGVPVRQQFSFSRDLHCWALEFNRTVSAVDSQFGFRLYLKSIPALKFVRGREGGMNRLGSGIGQGAF